MDQVKKKDLFLRIAVVLVVLLAAGLVFAKLYPMYNQPCSQPIKYTIGQFDSQFGISQADFLADVTTAANLWQDPTHKQFFEYSPTGAVLKINLIYDSRQEATDQLKSLGYTIENTQSSYNSLKQHYDTLMAQYNTQKTALDAATTQFNTDEQAYQKQVEYWNGQGGAPPDEATQLNQEYAQLSQRATALNTQKDQVNTLVNQINPLTDLLNNLASQLKLNVSNYNTVGSSQGGEFEEGDYTVDNTGRHIDIYEFNDQKELVRLLAHELGHSLGLQHVPDPTAIMYHLMDESQPNVATSADLAELDQVCHLKS